MTKDAAQDAGEEMENVEEDASEEFVEEAEGHMKMEFSSQMSPVTLKIQSGLKYQTRQEK